MAEAMTLVCFANSFKVGGRCIAGKQIEGARVGGWIRPVSARKTAELSTPERTYQGGGEPRLLDIFTFHTRGPAPHQHQTENHVSDVGRRWSKQGELELIRLPAFLDNPATLWVNNEHTTYGIFDCVRADELGGLSDSLVLIEPRDFAIVVGTNAWNGKRTYRGSFVYNEITYNLKITDPAILASFGTSDEGEYPFTGAVLSVSLTEPYEGDDRCHKLIAAVIRSGERDG